MTTARLERSTPSPSRTDQRVGLLGVSFGIAAMAMGLGIVFVLVGLALRALRSPEST